MKMSDMTVGQFASLSSETPGAWVDALETHATRVEDPENLPEGDVDLGDGSPVFELKNGYVETTTGDVYLQKESGAELLFTVDTSILQKNDSSGGWKPYVGPQGGTGWTNGDVVDYESDGPPGEIDQDATEQFLNQLPAEQRQDAREALGIDDDQGEVDGEQSDESGDSDLQYPLDGGDPRRDIDSVEQAQQVAQDFDPDDWEYDNWDTTYQPDIDMVEGQIVEANVDGQLFAMAGDGEPVVVTDPESNEAVTQDGDVIEIVGGQDAENAILAQWNDPATEVARGEKDWSGFRDAVVPDSVQDEIETAEGDGDDESEESSMPDWYDDDPVTERYDESDVDPDLEIEEGRSVSLNGDMVDIGRVQEGEDYTRFNLNDKELGSNGFVVSDGVLARRTGIDPGDTDEAFIEFQEESEYEDGWYQIGDDFYQEDGSDEYKLDVVTEDGEEIQFEGGFRGKEVDQAFEPVEEHTVETDLEELPEPTGSTDPADWNVNWTNLQEPEQADPDTNRPRLSSRGKEMFMREWKASVDEEAAESVETVIRSNKNDPFTTESQKFDKLIQEVMGVGGEPRSNGFDNSEEPTEAEVEAMEMFTEASREMFRQNFGESHTAHRGLAGFSHERLMEAIADDFTDTGNASGFEFELEDNPASIWSTDDTAARTFTTVMQDSDSMLKIEKEITPEDVFSMPESVIPFDVDDREYDTSSDWDEGEVNIPGDGISLVADDVQVPVLDGGDLTLSDILNHSDDLQQHQQYESVLVDAANMLNSFAPQEVQEQFRENLPDDAPEAAEEWLDREPVDITASVGKEVEKDTPTIDVSDQVPVLRRVRDLEDDVLHVVENADLARKLDAGYPDAPHEDAPPEVKQAVERWRKEVPESEKEDTALLYWLLGTGTPEYKFGKEDVDYKERPVDGMNCANCEYAYREVVSGKMICSQIRGEVKGEHWCRLWDGADSNTEQKGSRIQKPFAEYEDFSACTQANSDKDDPEAYCAQIHYNVTGEWPSEKHSKSYSITKAEIPEKYLDGTGLSESDFVPNVDVADNCEDVIEFVDEYGMPNPEDQREGINRAHQLNDAAANDEPIAFDYWNEIYNFHKRHRAQDNHECDESSIPDYRYEEVNQNQHDICFFDNGYYSDYTWGSDAGFEQAKRIVEAVESE